MLCALAVIFVSGPRGPRRGSGGPGKLNPISVPFDLCTQHHPSCEIHPPTPFLPFARAACQAGPATLKRGSVALLLLARGARMAACVCHRHGTRTVDPRLSCESCAFPTPPTTTTTNQWAAAPGSLQQSHVRFMPPPDVSWLYEKEMKVDLLQEEEEGR